MSPELTQEYRSQYIYRLNEAKILNVGNTVYADLFNANFGPAMNQRREAKVGYAAFNDEYHRKHVAIEGLNYFGNRKSTELLLFLLLSCCGKLMRDVSPKIRHLYRFS